VRVSDKYMYGFISTVFLCKRDVHILHFTMYTVAVSFYKRSNKVY